MEYKIEIQDALVLKSMLLNMGGSYADMILARKTAEQVFGPDDLKAYRVVTTPEGVVWNTTAEDGTALPDERTVELGHQAEKLITNTLLTLDEAKALKPFQIPLYEMFALKPKAS